MLHIKEVEFEGVPAGLNKQSKSPIEPSKAQSKVTFNEGPGPVLQSRQANKTFDGRKLLLNSNSERKEINLKYDKSAVETMHKASS